MRFSNIVEIRVISIWMALLSLPGMVAAQSHPIASDADSAAITQVCADFSGSFSRHDARGVAMTFAEDADFTNMGEDTRAARGN